MLNRKDFYAIEIETDEYHTKEVEYFETYQEAFENRMKYANWYRPQGDVYILRKSGKDLRELESWHIKQDGIVISHYNWERK